MPEDINDPEAYDKYAFGRYKRWAQAKGYIWDEQAKRFKKEERR